MKYTYISCSHAHSSIYESCPASKLTHLSRSRLASNLLSLCWSRPASSLLHFHHGPLFFWLHQAPLSLQLNLGQSLLCLCCELLGCLLCSVSLRIPDSDNWVLETESLCTVANSVREYLHFCSAFTQQTPSVVELSMVFQVPTITIL